MATATLLACSTKELAWAIGPPPKLIDKHSPSIKKQESHITHMGQLIVKLTKLAISKAYPRCLQWRRGWPPFIGKIGITLANYINWVANPWLGTLSTKEWDRLSLIRPIDDPIRLYGLVALQSPSLILHLATIFCWNIHHQWEEGRLEV